MRRTPVVLQAEAAECGIACLAMVSGAHGHRMDLPAMRRYCDVSLKGLTLRDLIRVAADIHLNTRPLRAEPHHLGKLRLPCILHWDHNHFVVLTRVGARGLTIHDPRVGQRRVTLTDAAKHFTGIILEIWPDEDFQPGSERSRVRITHLFRRTAGYAGAVAQILLLSFLLEVIIIAMPIGFQLVLDNAIVAMDRNLLMLVAIGLGLLLGFRVLTDYTRSWAILAAGSRVTLQWKMSLFSHLMKLPLDYFERRHVGDIASRFTSIDTIQKTFTTGPVSGLVDGVMGPVLIVMMFVYSPRLTIICLATTAVYAIARAEAYRLYRLANEEAIVFAAQENSHFIETLRGMPSIKSLGIERRRQGVWANYLSDRVNADVRVARIDLMFTTLSTALFGIDRVLVIIIGANAVMANTLTVGMLVAFLAYKDQFSQRIGQFLDTVAKLAMLSVHGERIADVALAEPEALGTPAIFRSTLPTSEPVLSARDIRFRYGDNEPEVLAGVGLDVAMGECVAVIGPSGSGKTTFLKILAGLLRPQSGTVSLHGLPLQALGLDEYRSQIGCVLQDDRLFAGSIADNIAGFAETVDRDLVQTAASLAAIHDEVVRLPMGYETLVGDMGSSLSGGQIQRIVLARALYRRPRLLLLDEATSHLDEENETAINRAICSLTIPRVIVAHRRSTIEMADRIIPILTQDPEPYANLIAGRRTEPVQ
jgi:ATP-binding cassette, subfamily B, bacterial CvaB/MchF/RaxB